jgi:probable HAF family extracellular repeat protein
LGTFDGFANSTARALHDAGLVVGAVFTTAPRGNGRSQAVIFADPLNPIADDASSANAVNAAGQVVGYSAGRAFFYSDGNVQDLGTLGGTLSSANAINGMGLVVGSSNLEGDNNSHAFMYVDGQLTDLGTLGGAGSEAEGINDGGQVVGSADVGPGPLTFHAFLWPSGQMTDLGALGGSLSGATAINSWGQIVGWSNVTFISQHAFLYSDGVMQDLGTLPGSDQSIANAINDGGQIVGGSGGQAFLHSGSTPSEAGVAPFWFHSPSLCRCLRLKRPRARM